MASRQKLGVVVRRLYDRTGRPLAPTLPSSLSPSKPLVGQLRVKAITAAERKKAERSKSGLSRQVAWLQLYASRLQQIGLLGVGEVSVQFDRTLPTYVYAAAISEHASIQLNPRTSARPIGHFERTSLIHELLHLGQIVGGRQLDAVLEATITFLADALDAQLHPRAPGSLQTAEYLRTPYPATFALPLLHWQMRAARFERRALLPWLIALYQQPTIVANRAEAFLQRLSEAERQLVQGLAQAQTRTTPGRAQHCRQDGHGQCAHSLLTSFLMAFGHEWSLYGTERDPALAKLRGGYPLPMVETGYAATVMRYALLCEELLATA